MQEHVVEPIKRSIAESVEQRSDQRLGLTARRAAILAAVVCVLTLTIAGPVRTYFAQRTEMRQLAATEAALRHQIADLEQQKGKLADPAFIAAQARERLGFVMPGRFRSGPTAPGRGGARRAGRRAGGRGQERTLVHLAVAHHRRQPAPARRCRRPPPEPAAPGPLPPGPAPPGG